jgi:hypothetical protein
MSFITEYASGDGQPIFHVPNAARANDEQLLEVDFSQLHW